MTYLLWLQEFRISINDALTPFFEPLSLFGVREILILPAFVYWCLNKNKGLMILFAWKLSQTFNGLIKLTACVYRPWIKDPRIIPAGDSLTTATGYSFPSGHTMMFTPIYAGMAKLTKSRVLKVIFWAAILLTMFSRNYLGVHTPQDVLVGLVFGLFALYIAEKVVSYLEKHPEKDILVMILCALLGILTLVYVTYKPYPMDYVDGKLLVDPVKMTVDVWGDAGGLAAFALMWFIESRFIKFEPTGINAKGIVLYIIGIIPLCWVSNNMRGVVTPMLGAHLGKLAAQSTILFHLMVFWPLVIKLFTGKKSN